MTRHLRAAWGFAVLTSLVLITSAVAQLFPVGNLDFKGAGVGGAAVAFLFALLHFFSHLSEARSA